MPRKVKYPLLVGVLLVGSAAASAALAGTDKTKPSVRIEASETSVTVKGKGFKARERIKLVLYAQGGPFTKKLTAGSRGGFSSHFAGACGPLAATATGASGNRASAKRIGIPAPCGIPIQP